MQAHQGSLPGGGDDILAEEGGGEGAYRQRELFDEDLR